MNTKKALASVLITTACSTGTAGPAMPKPRVATGEVGAPPAIACSPSAHYEAERGCTEDLYGVPLRVLVNRFSHMRFEPSGFTGNPNIPLAKSIVDYIFRWLGQKFLTEDEGTDSTMSAAAEKALKTAYNDPQMPLPMREREAEVFATQADAPPCTVCGTITVRAGACYACPNCGATSGCG